MTEPLEPTESTPQQPADPVVPPPASSPPPRLAIWRGKVRSFLGLLSPVALLQLFKRRRDPADAPVITAIPAELAKLPDAATEAENSAPTAAEENASLDETALPTPPLSFFQRLQQTFALSSPSSLSKRSSLLLIALTLFLLVGIGLGGYLAFSNKSPLRETPQQALEKRGLAYNALSFIEYAERNNLKVLDLFLAAGMDPNARRTFDQYTALIGAAERGHTDAVRLLLDRGASLAAIDRYGQTALMKAAGSGHVETVQYLLQRGAAVNILDKFGDNALKHALKQERNDIVALLRQHGASEPAVANKPTVISLPGPISSSPPGTTSAPAPASEFGLQPGQAGYIKLGTTIDALRNSYPAARTLTDYIYTSGVKHPILLFFFGDQSEPGLIVYLGGAGETASLVDVYDSRFQTAQGIRVGSPLSAVRAQHQVQRLEYEEGSLWGTAANGKFRFEFRLSGSLRDHDWLNQPDPTKIPDSLPVSRIVVY